jgi:hypothetical protein
MRASFGSFGKVTVRMTREQKTHLSAAAGQPSGTAPATIP